MSTENPDFGAEVAQMRHRLELSQEELARELGVSFVTVNRWEKGHAKPSKLAMAQWAAFSAKMVKKGRLAPAQGAALAQ